MKKTFALFCITAFLFGLAGCGEKSAKGNRFEGDKMVISVMTWDASQSFGTQPDELREYIQNRFGIVFEVHDVGWDNYDTLPLLWAQAGTLPDIIGGVSFVNSATFGDWIESDTVRALPDDLSMYPTLNNLVNQQYVQEKKTDDQVYFIPRISMLQPEWDATARGIINRRDWREKLGIPVPITEEDFLSMWQAFSNPANNLKGDGSVIFGVLPNSMQNFIGQTFAGHGNTMGGWTIQPDNSVVIPALEHTALPLMSFLRRTYKDGLIDPDFVTNTTHDVPMQNFAQGRAGTLLRQVSPIHLYNLYNHWTVYNPGIDFVDAIEILMPPKLSGVTPIFMMGTGFWSETYINASVDDEKQEKILQLYEWLYSEDGINTIMFGFEGKDWKMQDGEIIMLTPIDPDTGNHLIARDLYQFAAGGMRNLAVWAEDLVQWTNPGIPIGIRDMAIGARNNMLGLGMDLTHVDNRISALTVPEVTQMTLNVMDEWTIFITDISNVSSDELFARFQARWTVAGYDAAKMAMTSEAANRGWAY